MIFEDLRNRLAPFEGRYVLVRDFSHSFAETYGRGGQTPGPPTFVYVDANPSEEAVTQDPERRTLNQIWPAFGGTGNHNLRMCVCAWSAA